jgi:hypothetical protein
VQVGSEFFLQKNDMDESDKGEEMSLMEYVSNNGEIMVNNGESNGIRAAGLCFGLKNAAVLKSPNSEPKSIY